MGLKVLGYKVEKYPPKASNFERFCPPLPLPPRVHDVEVNYFTCGFTCHFFLLVFKLYAYVFTCATSKLFSQVKLHCKTTKSFTSTSCGGCIVISAHNT